MGIGTVLIADADYDSRFILSTALRNANLNVIVAADAESAHEIAMSREVDLVLLNYPMLMPDGTPLTRVIRGDANLRRVPIINVMSHVTAELVEDAAADGVTHTLLKPTDIWTVLQLVRCYIT